MVLECLREGQRFHLTFERHSQSGHFLVKGKSFSVATEPPTQAQTGTSGPTGALNDEEALSAPMPGKILKVVVKKAKR